MVWNAGNGPFNTEHDQSREKVGVFAHFCTAHFVSFSSGCTLQLCRARVVRGQSCTLRAMTYEHMFCLAEPAGGCTCPAPTLPFKYIHVW